MQWECFFLVLQNPEEINLTLATLVVSPADSSYLTCQMKVCTVLLNKYNVYVCMYTLLEIIWMKSSKTLYACKCTGSNLVQSQTIPSPGWRVSVQESSPLVRNKNGGVCRWVLHSAEDGGDAGALSTRFWNLKLSLSLFWGGRITPWLLLSFQEPCGAECLPCLPATSESCGLTGS